MKKGLGASVAFHGAILAAALVTLPAVDAFKAPPMDAVQVDISQITDESKRKTVTTEDVEKKPEPPAPKKIEPVKADPAPKVADEVKTAAHEDAPPPEPKKEEPKKLEDKPVDPDPLKEMLAAEAAAAEKQKQEEQKKADEKKKAEEKKKADAKKKADEKKKFDKKLAEAAAFLNKTDDEKTAPMVNLDKTGSPEKGDKAMAGSDDAVAATLRDALISKVRECFTVPPAARDVDISVPVHFTLSPEGLVLSVRADPSSDPVAQATASAAVSAVKGCEPYQLPLDKYDVWKDVNLDFNPNMLSKT